MAVSSSDKVKVGRRPGRGVGNREVSVEVTGFKEEGFRFVTKSAGVEAKVSESGVGDHMESLARVVEPDVIT